MRKDILNLRAVGDRSMNAVREYENPSRPWYLKMAAAVTVLLLVPMVIVPSILTISLYSFFVAYTWVVLWVREYYLRAIRIRIDESDLILLFRYSKPRRVDWSSVDAISLRTKHNKPTDVAEPGAFGQLILRPAQKLPRRFPLRSEVAVALREAYTKEMGRPPENRAVL